MNNLKKIQAYWDARPCNVRHSPKPIGTREYWDEVESRKYHVEKHIPAFAEFHRWKGKRVLEIGCGIGTDAINFARNGADYTGVDLSGESLAMAEQRFELYGFNGRFIHSSVENLPAFLPLDRYDLVYSFGVLHHTDNPRDAIHIIKGYLGFESEFRLMLYASNSWKGIMVDAGLSQWEAQGGCPKVMAFSESEATRLLDGLEILEMRQTHLFPYRVDDYVEYRYTLEPWFRVMPEKMFQALEKRLGCHLLIRCMDPSKQMP